MVIANTESPLPKNNFNKGNPAILQEAGEIAGINANGSHCPSKYLIVLSTGVTSSTTNRSEERRVGKECRSRWSPYH